MGTAKQTLFAVSKDEWNTKEDTGKPPWRMHACGMTKGTSQAKATSNTEKSSL